MSMPTSALAGPPSGENAQTLQQFVLQSARKRVHDLRRRGFGQPSKELEESVLDLITLLNSITLAVKKVGNRARTSGMPLSRENLQNLNTFANNTWVEELLYSQKSCVILSEDMDEPVIVQKEMQGKYTVVFDPLTGLSDPPAPDLGAIFGIFYQLSPETPGVSDILQPARNLVAAGYVLYSRCTTLMFSAGDGLHRFTLDSAMNEFILTQRNVRMPFYGNTYSINEGYAQQFDKATKDCVEHLKTEPSLDGTPRTFRYIGSMVADIHRTIMRGGIYMYPSTKAHPDGKLKLLYEAGPVAWLMGQAGGQASTGKHAIVNITPDSPHTRVPFFAGSEDEVALAAGFYADTPFGPVHQDPMWKLRRKHSIEQKAAEVKRGIKHSSEDGIVCCHLGVSA